MSKKNTGFLKVYPGNFPSERFFFFISLNDKDEERSAAPLSDWNKTVNNFQDEKSMSDRIELVLNFISNAVHSERQKEVGFVQKLVPLLGKLEYDDDKILDEIKIILNKVSDGEGITKNEYDKLDYFINDFIFSQNIDKKIQQLQEQAKNLELAKSSNEELLNNKDLSFENAAKFRQKLLEGLKNYNEGKNEGNRIKLLEEELNKQAKQEQKYLTMLNKKLTKGGYSLGEIVPILQKEKTRIDELVIKGEAKIDELYNTIKKISDKNELDSLIEKIKQVRESELARQSIFEQKQKNKIILNYEINKEGLFLRLEGTKSNEQDRKKLLNDLRKEELISEEQFKNLRKKENISSHGKFFTALQEVINEKKKKNKKLKEVLDRHKEKESSSKLIISVGKNSTDIGKFDESIVANTIQQKIETVAYSYLSSIGGINLKDDTIGFISFQPAENSEDKELIQNTLKLLTNDDRFQALYHNFKKEGKNENSYIEDVQKTAKRQNEIISMLKEILEKEIKDSQKVKDILEKIINNSFEVRISNKSYQFYDPSRAFKGGSVGSSVDEQISNIIELYENAGISKKFDAENLKALIYNAGEGMLGASLKEPLERYFSAAVHVLMFDDAISQTKKTIEDMLKTTPIRTLHFYSLNQLLFPTSTILEKTYEILTKANNALSNVSPAVIINPVNEGDIVTKKNKGDSKGSKNPWTLTFQENQSRVQIKSAMVLNFLDILNSLAEAF